MLHRLIISLLVICSTANASPIDDYNNLLSDEWHHVRTDHLDIYTNGDTDKAEELAVDLEKFREIFAFSTGFRPKDEIGKLQIYALAGDTFTELTKSPPNRAGFFIPRTLDGDEVFLKLNSLKLANGSSTQNDFSTATIFHEYVHYLVNSSGGGQLYYPPWYNEGMAEFFSTAYMPDDKTIVLGKAPAHRLLGLPERDSRNRSIPWLNMSNIFASTNGLPQSNTSDTYAQAWLIYHYFYANPERMQQTQTYLTLLNSGKPHDEAFKSAYGITPTAMDQELLTYYRRGKLLNTTYTLPNALIPAKTATREMTTSEKHQQLIDAFNYFLKAEQEKTEFISAANKQYPNELYVLNAQANAAYAKQDSTSLSIILQAMEKSSPDHRQTMLHRAHLAELNYRSSNNSVDREKHATIAAENLDKLLAKNKRDAHVIIDFANALRALNVSPEKTHAMMLRAWQLRPQASGLGLDIATIYLEENKPDKALQTLYVLRNRLGDRPMPEDAQKLLTQLESSRNKPAKKSN